jgi:hypothetical protein
MFSNFFKKQPEIQVSRIKNYQELRGPFGETKRTGEPTSLTYRGNDQEIKRFINDYKLKTQPRQINQVPTASRNEIPGWVAPTVAASVIISVLTGSDCCP